MAIFRMTCSRHLVATQVTLVCAVVRSRIGSVMCWNYETDFLLSGRRRRNTWKTCTTSRCSWETWISWKHWATLSRFCYWRVFLPHYWSDHVCLSLHLYVVITQCLCLTSPSLPVNIIWALVIFWKIKKVIRTVLCCVVYDSCAQWYAHTCEQFIELSVGFKFV